MDKNVLLRYARLAVPRYTSYPTAADFTPLDDAVRIGWLRGLGQGAPVSLYLHIPYCRDICHYCGCFTKAVRRISTVEDYAEVLIKDIHLQTRYLEGRPKVAHLHWGGGTPSILPASCFEKIMAALHQAFDFDPCYEHAIELDPRTVTAELTATLISIGVNRASLGVQDVNAQVQKQIGRVQPVGDVERAVFHLREAGIKRLNFDLIYGLPRQTLSTLAETCRLVGELEPDRIACYGYAHLPARRANQRLIDAQTLPSAFERFEQARLVGHCFEAQGYVGIGIDHYAKADDPMAIALAEHRLHRNFQGYTDDDCPTLIGFGVSSISEFNHGFAQTVADIGQYKRAIASGRLATVRGIEIDEEDRERAALIRDLMCYFAVDLGAYGGRNGFDFELEQLQPILADGIAQEQDGVITMTQEGRPFVRTVAALFDRYRAQNLAQFSAAV